MRFEFSSKCCGIGNYFQSKIARQFYFSKQTPKGRMGMEGGQARWHKERKNWKAKEGTKRGRHTRWRLGILTSKGRYFGTLDLLGRRSSKCLSRFSLWFPIGDHATLPTTLHTIHCTPKINSPWSTTRGCRSTFTSKCHAALSLLFRDVSSPWKLSFSGSGNIPRII